MDFICSASERTLKEAAITQAGEASNTRKQIVELLDKWAADALRAEIFSWFAANRGELARKLAEEANPFRLPRRFNFPRDASRWRRQGR